MKQRLTQPKNNKYYIRIVSGGYNGAVAGSPVIKGANVLCNCVGYANGRFNEIIGKDKCVYQLTCNAENFIESAKRQGLKISSTPIEGGIMVWQKGATLGGADGAGHVAVVEAVYDDGTILTSESGWASWAFKTIRRSNSNGRWGQASAYKFRGCIINPAVKDAKVVPAPKLAIDGIGGANTVRAMQKFFGTVQDGVLSGQKKANKKYYPALTEVEYGAGGSPCVKKLQKWLGITQNGVIDEKTVKAWQKKLGVTADGIFGTKSMKAWQKYLNANKKAVYPKEPVKTNGDKIAEKANEFAYTTKTSKARYPGGKAKEAYKAGIDKAYGKNRRWSTPAKLGASCDVFVGTCVRCAGVDKDYPRGVSPSYLAKSKKFKQVSKNDVQDGDIIVRPTHICIVYKGKIKEASYGDFYPMTTNTLKARLYAKGAKVYRAI